MAAEDTSNALAVKIAETYLAANPGVSLKKIVIEQVRAGRGRRARACRVRSRAEGRGGGQSVDCFVRV